MLRADIGHSVRVFLHGAPRDDYFLAEFELLEGGKKAVLTLDWYDLEGFVPPSPNHEAEQGSTDENGQADSEDAQKNEGDNGVALEADGSGENGHGQP